MARRKTVTALHAPMPSLQNGENNQLDNNVRLLLAEAQALSTRLATLNEVAAAMQGKLDPSALIQTMALQARWILDFQCCSVVLADRSGWRVQVLAPVSADQPASILAHPITPAIQRTLQHGHAQLLQDVSPHESLISSQSALILPLRDGERIVGSLNFFAHNGYQYSQDDLRIAHALAVQVSAMLQNSRLFVAATRARDELHTVLESSSDGVLVIDRRGRVLLLNSAFRRMLALGDASVQGTHALTLIKTYSGANWPITRQHVRQIFATYLEQPGSPASGTLQLATKQHIEWVSAPLIEFGQSVGHVLTLRDVSVRMELEQLRDDMIKMLIHDLRSPLSGIMLGFDLLEFAFEDGNAEEHTTTITKMRQAAGRLLEHVNTMLDINKLEAGKVTLDLAPCLLRDVVDSAVVSLGPLVYKKCQNIMINFPPTLPLVRADVRLLQRVFENLLGNALKFTPQNGEISIGATYNSDTHIFEVWVRDTGDGVPLEARERIFEKYGQAQTQQTAIGTGLGLTFCKLVVEAHGGKIGVRDAPYGGSLFWFTLPAEQPTG